MSAPRARFCRLLSLAVVLVAVGAGSGPLAGQTRPATSASLPFSRPTDPAVGAVDRLIAGMAEPVATVDVPASLRGILAEVRVKEGQAVKKGDVLAKLDDAVQVAQVEMARLEAEQTSTIQAAENQIRLATTELERTRRATQGLEVTQKEHALAQAQLQLEVEKDKQRQAQVKLKQEQITLDRMTLRSPIDGFVLKVNKQAGEQTDEGPVIKVVQTTRLNAVFFLPKTYFGKVAVGDKVALDFEGVKREGEVRTVDPIIASDLFRVKLEVDNADAKIPAGIAATGPWTKK
jgi:RND family efflux transporter MFP subunit